MSSPLPPAPLLLGAPLARAGLYVRGALLALVMIPAASAQRAPLPQPAASPPRPLVPDQSHNSQDSRWMLTPVQSPGTLRVDPGAITPADEEDCGADCRCGCACGDPSAPPGASEDCACAITSGTLPGFIDQTLIADWSQPVGVTVAGPGVLFVWEKHGVVWRVVDGVKPALPFLNISEEVGNWGDHGLLGFALDPNYASNGYVYVLYAVDYHHLEHFGTPQYSPALSEFNVDTIGRLARYTRSANGLFAKTSTRLVLLGETKSTGIPICSSTHGVGWLAFGNDGTLLLTTGDGSAGDGSGTCFSDGIITATENVNTYRAQLVNSLSGKVLRLDPATGDGVPSNPFYDPLAPRAPRSRVWSLGLRNPTRFGVQPGTGSPAPAAGDPGVLTIGDVGADIWEELNVVTGPAQNFGWPQWEGYEVTPFGSGPVQNKDAPNPLYNGPAGSCPQPFFFFRDLLVEDSALAPFWPHPCQPALPVSTSAPLFTHRRPALAWVHDGSAFAPSFDVRGAAAFVELGALNSPVAGEPFAGNCSIGGTFASGSGFPAPWDTRYFHADYGRGWIRGFELGAGGQAQTVELFADPVGRPVALAFDPFEGHLLYLDYTATGIGALHRIVYPQGNLPPVAALQTSQPFGPAPHGAAFDAEGSADPEEQPLRLLWDFGDGTPQSALAAPVHVFPSEDITAAGALHLRVLDMTPPGSTGFSNPDPEVLRDGYKAPLDSLDDQAQYDTIHGVGPVLDKFGPDWAGYTYPGTRSFVGLHFQEGMNYLGGGFFEAPPVVQVRQGGVWNDVSGVVTDPPYALGTAPHFETFEFRFPPVSGDGLRLYGQPGGIGDLEFFTLGELRVLALPEVLPAGPTNYTVTLTVIDEVGAEDTASATIFVNNTPPKPVIVSPAQFSAYANGVPDLVVLSHASSDAESSPGFLTCTWQTTLHHNTHTHPGPLDPNCSSSAVLLGDHGCGEGVFYYEISLKITDVEGLSAQTSHYLVPDCDRNLNGEDDAVDIGTGASKDKNQNDIPDEAETDCDSNGLPDLLEFFFGLAGDRNGNGVIDACEPFSFKVLPATGFELK
ncbi:MAG: PQQ-dependent sugar dehydrogenase [Planctomycetota bacterium]